MTDINKLLAWNLNNMARRTHLVADRPDAHKVGRIPDVWIDDSPMFITQGAAVSRFVRRS